MASRLWWVLLVAACGGSQTHVDWPKVTTCLTSQAPSVLSDVSGVLLAGGGDKMDKALEQQALVHGAAVIECAVAQLIQQWSSAPAQGIYPSPEGQAAERGNKWLQDHDIAVQREE
jgi:hypothetical protein